MFHFVISVYVSVLSRLFPYGFRVHAQCLAPIGHFWEHHVSMHACIGFHSIFIYIIWCASADERISLANVIKKEDSHAFCHLFLVFYIQKDVFSLQKRRKRVIDMTPQGKKSSCRTKARLLMYIGF